MRFFSKLTLIISLLVGGTFCSAQPILYGLQFAFDSTTSDPFDGWQRFVLVDPYSAQYSVIDTLDAVSAVALGASTFDHTNRRYIFWGIDSSQQQRLYNVDAPSGAFNSQPAISQTAIEFQYDLQQGALYALRWDQSTSTEYIVEIDLSTGQDSIMGPIAGVEAIALGTSTFNSNNGTFIFIGIDTLGLQRLYRVNARNGNIIANPVMSDRVIELEYDLTDNKLFGLFKQNTSSPQQLVEVDTSTGSTTVIMDFPGLSGMFGGIALGVSVYDQTTASYIFRGVNNGGDTLYVVETKTNRVYKNPMTENIIEIECDNTTFASRTYNPQTSLEGDLDSKIRLFPNPAQEQLWITFDAGVSDLPENATAYSIDGRMHPLTFNKQEESIRIDVNGLKAGSYFLVLEGKKARYWRRFIKK